jgi:hypothetical protein
MLVQGSQGHIESTGGWVNGPTLEGGRTNLTHAVAALAPLAPLIRGGVCVPVPHLNIALRRQEGVLSAVRHAVADAGFRAAVENPVDVAALTSDEVHGFQVVTGPVRSRADLLNQNIAPAAFYVARTVAIADAFGASYVPPSATDWALYENRIDALLAPALKRKARVDLRVVSALSRPELPLLRGMDAEAIASIHGNEESFEDWRRALRRAVKQIESSTTAGSEFEEESRDVLEDELKPMADEVAKAVSRSQLMREKGRDAKIALSSGVAVAGSAALAGAASPVAMATAAGSAVGTWLLGSLFPKRQSGARAVVAQLIQSGDGPPVLPRPEDAVLVTPKAGSGAGLSGGGSRTTV